MSMTKVIALSAVLLIGGSSMAGAQPGPAFPVAAPESVGMSREALVALDAAVRGYIERQEAVGAELMVIKDRKTVWHAAHGVRDVKTKAPMEIGGIFCVRSQTKPVVGTAIQMLIDDGKLFLDDRAAKHLPEFDSDSHRSITIKHLLEHRSGLTLSSLLTTDHKTLKSVLDIVPLAAKSELESEPGTKFIYSDEGTNVLAAIVEKVSGMPVAAYIESRIILPLGMHDTMCVLVPGDERLARVNSSHFGVAGSWERFWSPSETPLFPYFLGSASMYSTCEDYAKFLCLWADGGMAGQVRLLSIAAVERGLSPVSDAGLPTGFKGQEGWYAQLWETRVIPGEAGKSPLRVAFGHTGSDGTAAWMWPELDLIILYYTQSRGGTTSLSLEGEIDRLIIRGEQASSPAIAAETNAGLVGLYWDERNQRVWAVSPLGENLHVEIQGQTVMELSAADDGTWRYALQPKARVRFVKDDQGQAMRMEVGDAGVSRAMTRIHPDADLPSMENVEELVQNAHGLDRLHATVRREGTIKIPAMGIDSVYVEIIAKGMSLTEFEALGTRIQHLVREGRVWERQGVAPVEELTGPRAVQTVFQRSEVIFGGWRSAGAESAVVKRSEDQGRAVLLVRVRPPAGNSSLLYVEESTGRVVRIDQLQAIPGLGTVGLMTRFDDFEDVGGVVLPRQSSSKYSTPLLGTAATTFSSQTIIESGPDPFTLEQH